MIHPEPKKVARRLKTSSVVWYQPLTEFTRAAPFQEAGKITPVFVRFSTIAGERGSVDTLEDGAAAFIAAIGKHRHPIRETDPPRV